MDTLVLAHLRAKGSSSCPPGWPHGAVRPPGFASVSHTGVTHAPDGPPPRAEWTGPAPRLSDPGGYKGLWGQTQRFSEDPCP